MSFQPGMISVSVSFFGLIVILLLAFMAVKALAWIFSNANTARGWVAICGLFAVLALGMFFLAILAAPRHRVITGEEIAVSNLPLVVHRDEHVIDSSIPSLAGDVQHLEVASDAKSSGAALPAPVAAGESIEEMWKRLTAPRINLEEVAEAAATDAPRVGPSSPQELTEAAKVILSASLPGADPFTQGWLVNAAKSILGMPVSEQEQLALQQAAVEALSGTSESPAQSPSAVAASAAAVVPAKEEPFAHDAEAMSVSTMVQQPHSEPAQQAIAASIAALPKPDWVVNPPKQIGNVRKFVVVSDPFLTVEECRRDADGKMQNVALNRACELSGAGTRRSGAATLADLGLGGDYVRRELCTDEYIDVVDSSVGEMRKTYSLVEFNESQDALLIDRARSYTRQEGLFDVTLIGGGLLASVATLFGLLKVDTWTRGYYTKRLFLGVPAAIIAIGGFGIFWAMQ